jgi:DNA modification methylase
VTARQRKAPAGSGAAVSFVLAADLTPYARNARTHSAEQVEQIASMIEKFGWTTPALVDQEGGLIAGHGRVMAAAKLYERGKTLLMADGTPIATGCIPVNYAVGWSEDQKRAYVLADNQVALNAGWDQELLKFELSALQVAEFDMGLTGFSPEALASIFAPSGAGLTDPDEAPAVPVDPVSELGDVWLLGAHRLVCGDSTDPDAAAASLNGAVPLLMVTDPPYGVEYDASWHGRAKSSNGTRISSGVHAKGKVGNDDRADWREAWALFPGDVAYVWHAAVHAAAVSDSLVASGFAIRSQIIWAKQNFAIGRGDYHWRHEPCWYAVRKGKPGHYHGGRKQSTLWEIDKPQKSETGHSTQKPVECMKRPIENNSKPGDAVYEPFSGSGTTIIAGEMTGRAVHAIELSPAYVDVAVRRWEGFAGLEARHEKTGQTFAEVVAGRKGSAEAA